MKILEAFVKCVIAEDLEGFLRDTADIEYYRKFDAENRTLPADEDTVAAARKIKRAWARNVDRSFIQLLVKVHWIRMLDVKEFQKILDEGGKDELSATAFLPGEKLKTGWSNFGVVVDGYVTLASNSMNSIYSGFSYGKARDPMHASSGTPKRATLFTPVSAKTYILDRDSFDTVMSGGNELLVDNWKVTGLVLPIRPDGKMKATRYEKSLFPIMAKIADDRGVKIYNYRMQTFTLEEVVNSCSR